METLEADKSMHFYPQWVKETSPPFALNGPCGTSIIVQSNEYLQEAQAIKSFFVLAVAPLAAQPWELLLLLFLVRQSGTQVLLKIIQKTVAAGLLLGNFETEQQTSLYNKANSVDPLVFLPQTNLVQVALIQETELKL